MPVIFELLLEALVDQSEQCLYLRLVHVLLVLLARVLIRFEAQVAHVVLDFVELVVVSSGINLTVYFAYLIAIWADLCNAVGSLVLETILAFLDLYVVLVARHGDQLPHVVGIVCVAF